MQHQRQPQDTPATIGLRRRLQNAGQPLNLSQNDMMRLYLLDGILRRVAQSPYHHQFVLGGAFFLYKLVLGPAQARLTQDCDFSVSGISSVSTDLQSVVQSVAGWPIDDEVQFDSASVRVAPIMAGNPQRGLQVKVVAYLGKARDTITLHCSFDPVFPPGPQLRQLAPTMPTQPPIPVWTVPLEGIMAGKVEAMLRRGRSNTRFKDYWDIAHLATTQDFAGDLLASTLRATCTYYRTQCVATGEVFASTAFASDPAQVAGWHRFLAHLRGPAAASRTHQTPPFTAPSFPAFADVVTTVQALYRPVLEGVAGGRTWSHLARAWQ